MADVATPSAAQVATADAAPAPQGKQQFVRPEKPDEEKYKEELAKAEKAHTAAQEKLNQAKSRVNLAQGGGQNKDSPNAKRREELKSELNQIRQTQQGNKSSRNAVHDQIKRYDEQLKSRINELKTAKGKVNYKSAEDVDRQIKSLQSQVDTGKMKLVDEKKALTEITNLNKMKKNFGQFDAQQKQIDELKAKIADEKKKLDDPEQKALGERYSKLQAEMDSLKAEQDEAYKNLGALRDAQTKARNEQQEKYTAMKKLKDDYYAQKRAYQEYDFQARKARRERRQQEQAEWEANKRKERAAKHLEEASAPAFQDEINAAEGLIRYLDPSALPGKETAASSKFAASAQRTVDDSGFKGMRVSKKEDEDSYFIGGGGKKKKGGKKGGAAATPTETRMNLNLGLITELQKVDVTPPATQSDVPAVVEKLQKKLADWKANQDAETKKNIAKAQKELDKLEAHETDGEGATDVARKPAQKNQAVNGDKVDAEAELGQEKEAVADAAKELKEASLEDKTES